MMPEPLPCALRFFLSGAVTLGGAQEDPSQSLGGLASASELLSLGVHVVNPIVGLRVDYATGANGEGLGSIATVAGNALRYLAPNGEQGPVVQVEYGETKTLPDGLNPCAAVRVTRIGENDLAGACIVRLSTPLHSALSGGPVSSEQREEGHVLYRCLVCLNDSDIAISGLEFVSESDELEVGLELPVGGRLTDMTTEGETVPPPGVLFGGSAAVLGSIAAGGIVGVWIKRIIAMDTPASPFNAARVSYSFNADGSTYHGSILGGYRVRNDALARYEIYRGVDDDPDFDGEPWDTFLAGPHETAALDVSHEHRLVLRRRNAYGLVSQNINAANFDLDEEGSLRRVKPSAPASVNIEPAPGGTMRITAEYAYLEDGENAASSWLVYLATGSDPDPEADTPVAVSLIALDGIARLEYITSPYADETEVRTVVRVRRVDPDAGNLDSQNVDVHSAIAETDGPEGLEKGCVWLIGGVGEYVTVWQHEAGIRIDWLEKPGVIRFVIDGPIVAGIGSPRAIEGVEIEEGFLGEITQTEIIEYDSNRDAICLGVDDGGTIYRRMEVYASGRIVIDEIAESGDYPIAQEGISEIIQQGAADLEISCELEAVAALLSPAGTLTAREHEEWQN